MKGVFEIKILSIGNSFSQDAQSFLHNIARANGEDLKCVNLFVGGCSLRTHYLNMLDDESNYMFEFNGATTGIFVSIKEALKSDNWDYITIQQASHESFDFDNYIPYIKELASYIKRYSPKSKLLIHQTWAYDNNSDALKRIGYNSHQEMFFDVESAYAKAAAEINADGIIYSGRTVFEAYKQRPEIVYRDGFHLSLGFGRYMIGLLWFMTLYGKTAGLRHVSELPESISKNNMDFALETANKIYDLQPQKIKL